MLPKGHSCCERHYRSGFLRLRITALIGLFFDRNSSVSGIPMDTLCALHVYGLELRFAFTVFPHLASVLFFLLNALND